MHKPGYKETNIMKKRKSKKKIIIGAAAVLVVAGGVTVAGQKIPQKIRSRRFRW